MIDFSTLQGITIPEGAVTQIADASGKVLWKLANDKPIILEVEKITSDTYAAETTYTGEQFILLDIYPKTNGTVSVTYGGLTKTITDTSGVENPNAQRVFFGTFNGVSDSVATPTSGELTIEGDCAAFCCGKYNGTSKEGSGFCACITKVVNWMGVEFIPTNAFGAAQGACEKLTSLTIPKSVVCIRKSAFGWTYTIPSIPFDDTSGWYVTQTEGDASGTVVDVTNPTDNAGLLTVQYVDYYWYKS